MSPLKDIMNKQFKYEEDNNIEPDEIIVEVEAIGEDKAVKDKFKPNL